MTRILRTRRAVAPLSHADMPALSRAFEHPDDAACYVHEKIGTRREREYGGFILRRADGKYVATEPIAGKHFAFDPNDVFPRNEEEGYVFYPHGHDDYAVYHSHPSLFAGLQRWPESERAAYANSFSFADMYAVIDERELSLVSYLSGPDGGLIRYTLSDSLAENALFKRVSGPAHSPASSELSELYQALLDSRHMPSDFVRLVAAAGELQVVLASLLWGKVGKVAAHWQPYPGRREPGVCEAIYPPVQPVLTGVFSSADEVAEHVQRQLGNRQHCAIVGVLLKCPATGEYRAVEPVLDGEVVDSRCSLLHPDDYFRPVLPEGYRIDGLYFAPATQADQCSGQTRERAQHFFQPEDLHRVFEYRHVPIKRHRGQPTRYGFTLSEVYFCAPDGALLSYSPSHSTAEYSLVREVSRAYSGNQSIQSRLDTGRMSAVDFIEQVAGAGRLRVLVVSGKWPQAGVV